MKKYIYKFSPLFWFSICNLLIINNVNSQNLHTSSNAVSIENEVNTTTGWVATSVLTSDTENPNHGTYCFRSVTSPTNGREIRYTFPATIGQEYTISIWARQGTTSFQPAFANWTGFAGFATRLITGTAWAEYIFTLTATSTNPIIRIYTSPSSGATQGSTVFIDRVLITGDSDNEPPSQPGNLTASNITATSTTLSWTASTDNVGVSVYIIFQNNNMIGMVNGNTTNFNVTGLSPSTNYDFTVRARDAAGNSSLPSDPEFITTLPDIIPPTVPTNLIASNITSSSVFLSWSASTDNVGVTEYELFQDDVSIGPTGYPNTSYQVTGLQNLTQYIFNVVARDQAGNSSAFSADLIVNTPNAVFYSDMNANLPTVDWTAKNLYISGIAGIGTVPDQDFELSVNGNIRAKEIIVETGWPDFVFGESYPLPSLSEVEEHIHKFGHLKGIPSASEVQENGIQLADITAKLLLKIEELTLYSIQLNKSIIELKVENERLKQLTDGLIRLQPDDASNY